MRLILLPTKFLQIAMRILLVCNFSLIMVKGLQLHAQSVRVLSTKDGLPQSFVSGIVQDKEGFVWIGTRNGLSRFDGIEHKVLQHDLHDTTTIASNIIIWINKDDNNYLWIEYESGEIDKLDPRSNKVEHFIRSRISGKQPVSFVRRGWLVDHGGLFWGITKGHGLNTFDKASHIVKRYSKKGDGFSSDTLRGLLEDGGKHIWVLSQYGLSRFDKNMQRFTHYSIPFAMDFNNYFASDEEVVDLHERKNGEIIWGDRKNLYIFNPVSQSFRSISLRAYSRTGIKWIRTGPGDMDYFEINGEVFNYDDATGLSITGNAKMNSPEDARSFMVDRSGLLWVGTNADGIHQIDLVTPFFMSYPQVKNFPQDLLQQEFMLPMAANFNWTDADEKFSQPGYHFRSTYDYSRGRLYMALKENVVIDDYRRKTFIKMPAVPVAPSSTDVGIGIKGITVNPSGVVMVLGMSGQIFSFDSTRKLWQPFIAPDLLRKTFGPSLTPLDILADKDKLWITTVDDGLLYIDAETKQLHQLKAGSNKGDLPTNQLIGLKSDPTRPGVLWIGSYQGLVMFDKKTLKSEVLSVKEGLPDNTIYSILADQNGNLWLSTNKGLCRLNPITRQLRIFRSSYGLPGDEFNRFHHLELPDGQLAFGGTQGWTLFNPLSFKNDEYEPIVCLTNLKINNDPVTEEQKSSLLPLPLNAMDKLNLLFAENTITISFAGLQFNQPQDLLYRYQLKGYDDNWVMAGHSPVASYTKIPPGSYTLLVNASNTNGKWSSYIKSIGITVSPPWWRTWWAYMCYGIVLVGIVWGFISFRINSAVLRKEIHLKEKESLQLREVDEMKTKFFSNITHEFRTPLTLILGPAEELKQLHPQDARQVKLSDTITKNAGQLLFLINQLMELAKLEAKALKPILKSGSIVASVGSVVYSFENDARNKKIDLQLNANNINGNYWFAPDALERIIYNLVSNALKFTGVGGTINVTLTGIDKGTELQISDTGTGIAPDKLPFIFERFYQAGDPGAAADAYPHDQKGTGIGLAIVKELVELQGGTIHAESVFNTTPHTASGTVFTILLPYKLAESTATEDSEAITGGDEITDDQDSNGETRPQLLLAEDNAELAEFITGSLQHMYKVHHVLNGALAVEAALQIMPDIIVSDILMPVMDGIALCEKLKDDIRTSHIPVILLTAKASQENRIEGLSKGADDYLTKPFHVTELLLRIRNQLEQRRRITEFIRQQLSAPVASLHDEPVNIADPFVDRLHELVEEHLDDPLFGVDQLLSSLDMSRTSLHRKIKALSGMSTTELVRNYRLQRATQFLRQGESSTSAGYMAGFGSPSYFTKCFREKYGLTPGEFIEQQKI